MAKNGADVEDAWENRHKHRAAVKRNYDRSEMLKAIILSWEKREDADQDYLRGLRKRQRQAENQLKAMKI
jgi:hypothetical protein